VRPVAAELAVFRGAGHLADILSDVAQQLDTLAIGDRAA
jgi:hypothetical protein